MSTQNPLSFDQSLKTLQQWGTGKAPFAKISVIVGTNIYLHAKILAKVKQTWTQCKSSEVVEINCQQTPPKDIMERVGQPELFGDAPLYHLNHAEHTNFSGIAGDLFQRQSAHVVLSISSKKLSDKLAQKLKALAPVTFSAADPAPFDIPKVAAFIAADAGLQLQPDALRLLSDATGQDLGKVDNEAQKLALIFSADPKKPVKLGAKDIAEHLGMLREDVAFKLKNLLLDLNYPLAQTLVFDLTRRGESGLAILGILAKHLRQTITMLDGLKNHLNPAELARACDLHPGSVKRYTEYCRKVGARNVERALEACVRADRKLKSGHGREDLVLSEIIALLHT